MKVDGISSTITARYFKGGAEDGFISVDDKYYLSDKLIKYFKENHIKNQEKGNGFKFQPGAGDGVATSITTKEGVRMESNFIESERIRRLTPLECWRLQDFPDDAFFKAADVCSDTQLYKQAGNSITVAVIQKIIQKIY